MTNYDLTVEELKEKKITGIKLPGSIDDFGFTIKDDNKIEVPIHGVQNGTVELELLGRADTIEFVAEEVTPNTSNTPVEPVAAQVSNAESTSETHANPEPTAETATPETAHAETTVESL